MLHVAIVEDEAIDRQRLKEYIERFAEESGEKIRISLFRDGIGLVSPYQNIYDIILLDVQMEFMDGIRTAEKIREMDDEVIIIFITNMVQYALKGYSVNAMNFVLKPISYFAFCEEMKQAVKRIQRRQDQTVVLKTEDGLMRLKLGEIICAEMKNRKLHIYTGKGVLCVSGTLVKLETMLQDTRFFRCHSGYLINLQHVEKIQADRVFLDDGCTVVPVSRYKKRELELQLINYLGEQMG